MSEESLSQGMSHYVRSLENRINRLEDNLVASQAALKSTSDQVEELLEILPNTAIISQSFVQRAFAVWGHYFMAQIMIAIPVVCVIVGLSLLGPGLY